MSYNDWTISPKKALQAFPKLSATATSYITYTLIALGVLGFLDAAYLTILHYKNAIPPCTLSGCETVLTSKYAMLIPGIPTSLIGAAFYLLVVVLVGIQLSMPSTSLRQKDYSLSERSESKGFSNSIPTLLVLLTGTGLLMGIFLVYLQAFVLHAFCQYCLVSELIDFLLFDCAWWLWRKNE